MAKCFASAGKTYKKTMRVKKSKTKVWKKVSAEELRLMKMWYKEDGKAPAEIARLLHRDKATISRRLHNKVSAKQQGAKRVLTLAQVDRLIAKTKAYIKQAKVSRDTRIIRGRWVELVPRVPYPCFGVDCFRFGASVPQSICEIAEGTPDLLQAVEVPLQWLPAVAPPWHRAKGGGFLPWHPRLSRGLTASSQAAHRQLTVSSQSAHVFL